MDPTPLHRAVEIIEAAPGRAQSLMLYGLIKMLATEQAGIFSLRKLQEMDADSRALCYGLMELYAREGYRDPVWQQAVARVDRAVSGRPRD